MKKIKPPVINQNKIETESPFVQYCTQMDDELHGQPFEAWERYAKDLWRSNPTYITNALLDDFKFRARFQMNIIMSIEGPQGEFKSLFGLWWSYKLGEIFGVPFDMEKNLYGMPEELEHNVRESPYRSTHFLDEQNAVAIGSGSRRVAMSLIDFEEKGRWTQRNLIYASPYVGDHAHYFVFRSYASTRVNNPKCACNPECLQNRWTTQCGIPFWERTGYPESMTFIIETKRKIDNLPVVRGLVTIPMPTPETIKAYDVVKARNIARYDAQEDASSKYMEQTINDFVEAEGQNLIIMTGAMTNKIIRQKMGKGEYELVKIPIDTRRYKVVSMPVIKNFLFNYLKTRRKYTISEISEICAVVHAKVLQVCRTKNEELEREKEKVIDEQIAEE